MNLFITDKSHYITAQELDDKRLIKQILECKTILDVALNKTNGYAKHPVIVYYKDYPLWVLNYTMILCKEYTYRFNRMHNLYPEFIKENRELLNKNNDYIKSPKKGFYYVEGLKTDPNCKRIFGDECINLFHEKLCKKWNNDKIKPIWTKRNKPNWYKNEEL